LRERAVRLVAECRPDHALEWEAMRSVAQKLGIGTTELCDSRGTTAGDHPWIERTYHRRRLQRLTPVE
jgi:hypothetical protein